MDPSSVVLDGALGDPPFAKAITMEKKSGRGESSEQNQFALSSDHHRAVEEGKEGISGIIESNLVTILQEGQWVAPRVVVKPRAIENRDEAKDGVFNETEQREEESTPREMNSNANALQEEYVASPIRSFDLIAATEDRALMAIDRSDPDMATTATKKMMKKDEDDDEKREEERLACPEKERIARREQPMEKENGGGDEEEEDEIVDDDIVQPLPRAHSYASRLSLLSQEAEEIKDALFPPTSHASVSSGSNSIICEEQQQQSRGEPAAGGGMATAAAAAGAIAIVSSCSGSEDEESLGGGIVAKRVVEDGEYDEEDEEEVFARQRKNTATSASSFNLDDDIDDADDQSSSSAIGSNNRKDTRTGAMNISNNNSKRGRGGGGGIMRMMMMKQNRRREEQFGKENTHHQGASNGNSDIIDDDDIHNSSDDCAGIINDSSNSNSNSNTLTKKKSLNNSNYENLGAGCSSTASLNRHHLQERDHDDDNCSSSTLAAEKEQQPRGRGKKVSCYDTSNDDNYGGDGATQQWEWVGDERRPEEAASMVLNQVVIASPLVLSSRNAANYTFAAGRLLCLLEDYVLQAPALFDSLQFRSSGTDSNSLHQEYNSKNGQDFTKSPFGDDVLETDPSNHIRILDSSKEKQGADGGDDYRHHHQTAATTSAASDSKSNNREGKTILSLVVSASAASAAAASETSKAISSNPEEDRISSPLFRVAPTPPTDSALSSGRRSGSMMWESTSSIAAATTFQLTILQTVFLCMDVSLANCFAFGSRCWAVMLLIIEQTTNAAVLDKAVSILERVMTKRGVSLRNFKKLIRLLWRDVWPAYSARLIMGLKNTLEMPPPVEAVYFSGGDAGLLVNVFADECPFSFGFTFAAWLYWEGPTASDSENPRICRFATQGTPRRVLIDLHLEGSSGMIMITTWCNGEYMTAACEAVLPREKWSFLAVTMKREGNANSNKATLSVYVDDALASEGCVPLPDSDGGPVFGLIGCPGLKSRDLVEAAFRGAASSIIILADHMTPKRVKSLYARGPTFPPPPSLDTDAALILSFHPALLSSPSLKSEIVSAIGDARWRGGPALSDTMRAMGGWEMLIPLFEWTSVRQAEKQLLLVQSRRKQQGQRSKGFEFFSDVLEGENENADESGDWAGCCEDNSVSGSMYFSRERAETDPNKGGGGGGMVIEVANSNSDNNNNDVFSTTSSTKRIDRDSPLDGISRVGDDDDDLGVRFEDPNTGRASSVSGTRFFSSPTRDRRMSLNGNVSGVIRPGLLPEESMAACAKILSSLFALMKANVAALNPLTSLPVNLEELLESKVLSAIQHLLETCPASLLSSGLCDTLVQFADEVAERYNSGGATSSDAASVSGGTENQNNFHHANPGAPLHSTSSSSSLLRTTNVNNSSTATTSSNVNFSTATPSDIMSPATTTTTTATGTLPMTQSNVWTPFSDTSSAGINGSYAGGATLQQKDVNVSMTTPAPPASNIQPQFPQTPAPNTGGVNISDLWVQMEKQLVERFVMNLRIWMHASGDTQEKLLRALQFRYMQRPEYYRKHFGLQFLLDSSRKYYWATQTIRPSPRQLLPTTAPAERKIDGLVVGQRPDAKVLARLRRMFMSLAVPMLQDQIHKEEVKIFVQFIFVCPDSILRAEAFRLALRLMGPHSPSWSSIRTELAVQGWPLVLVDFMADTDSSTRLCALHILVAMLTDCSPKVEQDFARKGGYSLLEKQLRDDMADGVTLEELYLALRGLLTRVPSNERRVGDKLLQLIPACAGCFGVQKSRLKQHQTIQHPHAFQPLLSTLVHAGYSLRLRALNELAELISLPTNVDCLSSVSPQWAEWLIDAALGIDGFDVDERCSPTTAFLRNLSSDTPDASRGNSRVASRQNSFCDEVLSPRRVDTGDVEVLLLVVQGIIETILKSRLRGPFGWRPVLEVVCALSRCDRLQTEMRDRFRANVIRCAVSSLKEMADSVSSWGDASILRVNFTGVAAIATFTHLLFPDTSDFTSRMTRHSQGATLSRSVPSSPRSSQVLSPQIVVVSSTTVVSAGLSSPPAPTIPRLNSSPRISPGLFRSRSEALLPIFSPTPSSDGVESRQSSSAILQFSALGNDEVGDSDNNVGSVTTKSVIPATLNFADDEEDRSTPPVPIFTMKTTPGLEAVKPVATSPKSTNAATSTTNNATVTARALHFPSPTAVGDEKTPETTRVSFGARVDPTAKEEFQDSISILFPDRDVNSITKDSPADSVSSLVLPQVPSRSSVRVSDGISNSDRSRRSSLSDPEDRNEARRRSETSGRGQIGSGIRVCLKRAADGSWLHFDLADDLLSLFDRLISLRGAPGARTLNDATFIGQQGVSLQQSLVSPLSIMWIVWRLNLTVVTEADDSNSEALRRACRRLTMRYLCTFSILQEDEPESTVPSVARATLAMLLITCGKDTLSLLSSAPKQPQPSVAARIVRSLSRKKIEALSPLDIDPSVENDSRSPKIVTPSVTPFQRQLRRSNSKNGGSVSGGSDSGSKRQGSAQRRRKSYAPSLADAASIWWISRRFLRNDEIVSTILIAVKKLLLRYPNLMKMEGMPLPLFMQGQLLVQRGVLRAWATRQARLTLGSLLLIDPMASEGKSIPCVDLSEHCEVTRKSDHQFVLKTKSVELTLKASNKADQKAWIEAIEHQNTIAPLKAVGYALLAEDDLILSLGRVGETDTSMQSSASERMVLRHAVNDGWIEFGSKISELKHNMLTADQQHLAIEDLRERRNRCAAKRALDRLRLAHSCWHSVWGEPSENIVHVWRLRPRLDRHKLCRIIAPDPDGVIHSDAARHRVIDVVPTSTPPSSPLRPSTDDDDGDKKIETGFKRVEDSSASDEEESNIHGEKGDASARAKPIFNGKGSFNGNSSNNSNSSNAIRASAARNAVMKQGRAGGIDWSTDISELVEHAELVRQLTANGGTPDGNRSPAGHEEPATRLLSLLRIAYAARRPDTNGAGGGGGGGDGRVGFDIDGVSTAGDEDGTSVADADTLLNGNEDDPFSVDMSVGSAYSTGVFAKAKIDGGVAVALDVNNDNNNNDDKDVYSVELGRLPPSPAALSALLVNVAEQRKLAELNGANSDTAAAAAAASSPRAIESSPKNGSSGCPLVSLVPRRDSPMGQSGSPSGASEGFSPFLRPFAGSNKGAVVANPVVGNATTANSSSNNDNNSPLRRFCPARPENIDNTGTSSLGSSPVSSSAAVAAAPSTGIVAGVGGAAAVRHVPVKHLMNPRELLAAQQRAAAGNSSQSATPQWSPRAPLTDDDNDSSTSMPAFSLGPAASKSPQNTPTMTLAEAASSPSRRRGSAGFATISELEAVHDGTVLTATTAVVENVPVIVSPSHKVPETSITVCSSGNLCQKIARATTTVAASIDADAASLCSALTAAMVDMGAIATKDNTGRPSGVALTNVVGNDGGGGDAGVNNNSTITATTTNSGASFLPPLSPTPQTPLGAASKRELGGKHTAFNVPPNSGGRARLAASMTASAKKRQSKSLPCYQPPADDDQDKKQKKTAPGGAPTALPFSPFNQGLQRFIKSCGMVKPSGVTWGRMVLKESCLTFYPRLSDGVGEVDDDGNLVGGDERWWNWQHCSKPIKCSIVNLKELHPRRYLLQHRAMELFFPHRSLFFTFSLPSDRDEAMRAVERTYKMITKKDIPCSYSDATKQLLSEGLQQKWGRGEMSTFDFLVSLNILAGRSYNDLGQYPVFPWVIADYTSKKLDLSDPATFRDFSRPIGAQRKENEELLAQRYVDSAELVGSRRGGARPFHYGSHYSNRGFVLHYLVRMEPFTSMALDLQGGVFDHADRLFHSVSEAFGHCVSTSNHVSELIPEFFFNPHFLENRNHLDLGTRSDSKVVDCVLLPPWAESAEHFIHMNRQALESPYVSAHIHQWIDLVFGFKQTGPEAKAAFNVFHYMTYDRYVSGRSLLPSEEVQIAEFGQTPLQLFNTPHPKREDLSRMGKPAAQTIFDTAAHFECFNVPLVADGFCPLYILAGETQIIAVADDDSHHIFEWRPLCPDAAANTPFTLMPETRPKRVSDLGLAAHASTRLDPSQLPITPFPPPPAMLMPNNNNYNINNNNNNYNNNNNNNNSSSSVSAEFAMAEALALDRFEFAPPPPSVSSVGSSSSLSSLSHFPPSFGAMVSSPPLPFRTPKKDPISSSTPSSSSASAPPPPSSRRFTAAFLSKVPRLIPSPRLPSPLRFSGRFLPGGLGGGGGGGGYGGMGGLGGVGGGGFGGRLGVQRWIVISSAVAADSKIVSCGHWDRTIRGMMLKSRARCSSIRVSGCVINCIATPSSGHVLVGGGSDGTLRLWQFPRHDTGQTQQQQQQQNQQQQRPLKERVLCAHSESVQLLAVNEDVDTIATYSRDGSIGFHCLSHPRTLHHIHPPQSTSVLQMVLSSNGDLFLILRQEIGTFHSFFVARYCLSGKLRRMEMADERPCCIICPEAADCIITAGVDGCLVVRDSLSLQERFKLATTQAQSVTSLAMSADGNHILAGLANGRMDVFANVDRTSNLMTAMFAPEFNAM